MTVPGIAAMGTVFSGTGFTGHLTNIEVEKAAAFANVQPVSSTALLPSPLKTQINIRVTADIHLDEGSWTTLSGDIDESATVPQFYTLIFPDGTTEDFWGIIERVRIRAPYDRSLDGSLSFLATVNEDPATLAKLSNGTVISGLTGLAQAHSVRVRGTRTMTDITDSTTTGKPKLFPELYGLEISCELFLISGTFNGYLNAQRAGTYVTIAVSFPDGSTSDLSGYITVCEAHAVIGEPLRASCTFVESDPL